MSARTEEPWQRAARSPYEEEEVPEGGMRPFHVHYVKEHHSRIRVIRDIRGKTNSDDTDSSPATFRVTNDTGKLTSGGAGGQ